MSKKSKNVIYHKQPLYYKDFSCVGGTCPMSCCLLWRVDWEKMEVEKLRAAECSEHLRELIDNSFVEFNDQYIVKMDDSKRCPFLNEDNLCSIQKELGPEYLSYTCQIYPRHSEQKGNVIINYCNSSCYRVIDMLCNDKDSTVLENVIPKSDFNNSVESDGTISLFNHPELKYRLQLFDFFYEILSDESRSIETSVTLGALAAHSLTKLVEKGEYDKIPDTIKALSKDLNNPAQLEKLNSLKPNYAVKLGFASEMDRLVIGSDLITWISVDGEVRIDLYERGVANMNACFADRPFFMRNIALNLFMECHMPFRLSDKTIFENYCYYAAAVAAMKFIAVTVFSKGGSSCEHFFKTLTARISRFFAHNDKNVEKILDVFRQLNCMSPAYIALILK